MTQRVGRGIAVLFHDRGTRREWGVSSTPRPHFTLGKNPVPIVQEAGWAPGPVWTGRKSRPHRDSIPDRPARSQSLYRLSYPANTTYICGFEFRRGHGCISVMNIVCCQVEVSATSWSLIQRSPTECGVSECDLETSTNEEPRPSRGLWSHEERTHCSLPKTDNWMPHKTDFRHFVENILIFF